MKETRILCDICGKVIDSESPVQFASEAYLRAPEIEDGVPPTRILATVVLKQTGVDDPFTYDACEACVRVAVKNGVAR